MTLERAGSCDESPHMAMPTQSDAYVVEFCRVNKSFGHVPVLRDISFAVKPAEIVIVCGPSGSGKSTLIRCINQLEPIQSGTISIFGRPVNNSKRQLLQLRSAIGMVFQTFNLYPHKTALENVTLAPVLTKRAAKREARDLAMALLERVGVADKADVYPAYLSGGQQQRVAIARALAMQPKLMLFDEPTSALDPEMINEVLQVIAALAKDGMTMVIVTHEMGFARSLAHRIMFMDHGEILESSPAHAFFSNPQNERTKLFLSKILSHDVVAVS
jgi:ABC-type polar amino acid transport system ATPase subunit